jgi:hypothetical protein
MQAGARLSQGLQEVSVLHVLFRQLLTRNAHNRERIIEIEKEKMSANGKMNYVKKIKKIRRIFCKIHHKNKIS